MQHPLRPWALLLVLVCSLSLPALAQRERSTAQPEGLRSNPPSAYALVGATVITAPGQRLDGATVLIENGIIIAVGKAVTVPAYAQTVDAKGKWIYAGWIDPYTHLGSEDVKTGGGGRGGGQVLESQRSGSYYWNDAVRAEFDLEGTFKLNETRLKALRAQGFTVAQAAPNDGIFRGQGIAMHMGAGDLHNQILRRGVGAHLSFAKGSSKMDYPGSLMGSIALIRQTILDAQWYQQAQAAYQANPAQPAIESNASLAAVSAQLAGSPFFFEAGTAQDVLRAARIGAEFKLPLIIKASGFEYEILDDLAEQKLRLILPLNYPQAYDVEDPADADNVSLSQLRRWEQAPLNAYALYTKNIPFAFTAFGLKEAGDLWKNIRKTVALGLPAENALAALTTYPAELLGISSQVGSVEKGKRANLVVANGDVFTTEAAIEQVWVAGQLLEGSMPPSQSPLGTWNLTLAGKAYTLDISGAHPAFTAKVKNAAGTDLNTSIALDYGLLNLNFSSDTTAGAARYFLKGAQQAERMDGQGYGPDGTNLNWTATRTAPRDPDTKTPEAVAAIDRTTIAPVTFPNNGYGFTERPKAGVVVFKNATVWTNTKSGILRNADVLIENGIIKQVGTNITAPKGASVVDGTGLHLTNGIIDEHSHIAIDRGVNEGTQAVTAEVRIGDVLDPESVMIYRQLAGGVTGAQLLHGSANPMGGQSAIIKLRWGLGAEDLKFAEAPGFIKFALGENVKQSNWGDANRTRYPQTRLGVEQLMQDAFTGALEYRKQWDAYRAAGAEKSGLIPPRRDLESECLLEILDSKRFVTCHSYVQSEITMLIRLADRLKFRLNTFTHILEGYKVADKMATHGSAASTFADWWAYKYEVYEANAYNAGLMAQQGVTVAINSDDAEMARRLNQEAAKSVKYTGMSEEDAWKMVTLNPATMLHVDKYVGSLEAGKQADLVLWSDNPLSIYAKPRQTYVDGVLLYDLDRDAQLRQQIIAERNKLIQKMVAAKQSGGGAKKPERKKDRLWHCDDLGEFIYQNEDGYSYEAGQETATQAAQRTHTGSH